MPERGEGAGQQARPRSGKRWTLEEGGILRGSEPETAPRRKTRTEKFRVVDRPVAGPYRAPRRHPARGQREIERGCPLRDLDEAHCCERAVPTLSCDARSGREVPFPLAMDSPPVISAGLEAVFLGHRAALLRFLRARGAGDGAEDLLQELWIKAAAGAHAPIADPLAYLYRAANNLMLDRHRSALRGARRDLEWSDTAGTGVLAVADAPSGERVLIAREELAAAEAALAALGERTDLVFRRFRVEGASQRAIADELGISLSAVEKHLQKAYRALIDLRRRRDAE